MLIRSSYALNFSPRAYRESKVKKSASYDYAIREKPSKPSLFVKSFACAKIYVYCMHFYRISPDSKIIRKYSFANFFFFFFFFFQISITFCIYISPVFQVRSTFTSIRYIIVVIVSKKLGALRKGNVERLSGLRASSLGEITR